jgi:drug/metabolite transporter (DMT)-like permease
LEEVSSGSHFWGWANSVIRKLAAIDFFGAFLALAGSALLVLALTWAGGEYSWSSAHVLASLVVGAVMSVGFVLWQWKGTHVPLVPSKSLQQAFRDQIVS